MKKYIAILAALALALPSLPANADTYTGDPVIAHTAVSNTRVSGTVALSTSQLDKTSDVTLANIPGLAVSLQAGKSYICTGILFTTSGGSGGVKFALATPDTLTATSIRYGGVMSTAISGGGGFTTTLGTGLGNTSAIVEVAYSASIVVNAAGTLVVQAAQNASNATPTSVFANSNLQCLKQGL